MQENLCGMENFTSFADGILTITAQQHDEKESVYNHCYALHYGAGYVG